MCMLVVEPVPLLFFIWFPEYWNQDFILQAGGWKILQNGPAQEERSKCTENPKFSNNMAQPDHSQRNPQMVSLTHILRASSFWSLTIKY